MPPFSVSNPPLALNDSPLPPEPVTISGLKMVFDPEMFSMHGTVRSPKAVVELKPPNALVILFVPVKFNCRKPLSTAPALLSATVPVPSACGLVMRTTPRLLPMVVPPE